MSEMAPEVVHEVANGMAEVAHLHISAVPVWAIVVPLIGAALAYLIGRKSEKSRDVLAVAITIFTFGLVASMYPVITEGGKIVYTIHSDMLLYDMGFVVDPLAFLFAAITSFVWMLATIYSLAYMSHEHARNRYYSFLLLTLAVNLGVLLAGDLFMLYIFFELLALSSYVLVIHEETKEALRAGRKYLFIGIAGGLCLLAGIFLLYTYTGTLEITPLLQEMGGMGNLRYLVCALMIIGFGAKAGIFPIHVWLPEAHPVAPSPASALLSGIMVKAGIYGMLRTVNMIFTPAEVVHGVAEHVATWSIPANIGYWVIWIAMITMFMGWVLALLQDNIKRLLAYSTISQIGYIVMGIGCAAYLGYDGAMGMTGTLYHVANHALYKSCLFLCAGAIYFRTGELSMKKLGGLWRNMPLVTIICLIATLGITGIPGFNGYVSKTLLHHAIVESFEHHGDWTLRLAEILFTITGGGTVAYYLKLMGFTFFGKRPDKLKNVKDAPLLMLIPMGILAVCITTIGFYPDLLLNNVVVPSLGYHMLDMHFIEHHIVGISVWTLKDLTGIGISVAIGIGVFMVVASAGLLDAVIPRWFGVDYWYGKIANAFIWFCKKPTTIFDRIVDAVYIKVAEGFLGIVGPSTKLDREIDKGYLRAANGFLGIVGPSAKLDEDINKAYIKGAKEFLRLAGPATKFDKDVDRAYTKGAKGFVDFAKGRATKFDKDVDRAYVKGAEGFVDFAKGPATRFDRDVDKGYEKGAEKAVALTRRPVARAEGVDISDLYDRLTRFGADPIPVIALMISALFASVGMLFVGVIKYPYALLDHISDLITERKEPLPTISERVDKFEREFEPGKMPYVESIGFALLIVALMLTIYIIYIALEYILHF